MIKRFWRRHRVEVAWVATYLGAMGWVSESTRDFLFALPMMAVGIWVLVLCPLWLNWTQSEELTEEFPPERVDRPIPFTTRCSQMRFYSDLPPEELWQAVEAEIAIGNEKLGWWHKKPYEDFSWKKKWKSTRSGDQWVLQLFRETKEKNGGASTNVYAGTRGAGLSFGVGISYYWKRNHGAIFEARIEPWENGSMVEGCFSAGHLVDWLWLVAIWFGTVLILLPRIGYPEFAILGTLIGIHGLLDPLGRGSYGVSELTLETQDALLDFFGEPEILE